MNRLLHAVIDRLGLVTRRVMYAEMHVLVTELQRQFREELAEARERADA